MLLCLFYNEQLCQVWVQYRTITNFFRRMSRFRILLHKGSNTTHLIKLTKGSAYYSDPLSPSQPFLTLTAPAYLNLTENAYNCPNIKNIVALGKAKTQCVKLQANHLTPINNIKNKGIRKNLFPAFHSVHPASFYEIALHGETISLRCTQSLILQKETIYMVVRGRLVVRAGEVSVVVVGDGEVVVGCGLAASAECNNTVLHLVPKSLARFVLGAEYKRLEQLEFNQKAAYQQFQKRNRKTIHKVTTTQSSIEGKPPTQFQNPIQRRMDMLQKFNRTRSCLSRSISPRLKQIHQHRKVNSKSESQSQYSHHQKCNSMLSAKQSQKENGRWVRKASIRQYYAVRERLGDRATFHPGSREGSTLYKRATVGGKIAPFRSQENSKSRNA